jgi:integrase
VYGHIIRLLILTGQRVGQFQHLRREWIGADTITWPAKAMKGNREHTIPIGPLTQAELAKLPIPLSFTNWSHAHRAYLQGSGLAHHTRHDLRRSYSTVMAEWTPPHVLSRLLAHAQPGVMPTYNRYEYVAEKREAVLTFEAHHLKASREKVIKKSRGRLSPTPAPATVADVPGRSCPSGPSIWETTVSQQT